MSFTYENNGPYSYLVYRFEDNDKIDRTTLGMITNNTIPGFAPSFFTQTDSGKYIKYNISSRISARNFFSGGVTKKRLLRVISCILDAIMSAEDYIIDTQNLILDLDYIFVDIRTSNAVLICLPNGNQECRLELVDFLKSIVFGVQYPQNENNDYVTRLMNELNKPMTFQISDFKDMITSLLEPTEEPVVTTWGAAPPEQIPHQVPQQLPVMATEILTHPAVTPIPERQATNSSPQPVPTPERTATPPIVETAPPQQEMNTEKKKKRWSLFHRKDKPKKDKKESPAVSSGAVGFSIPGQDSNHIQIGQTSVDSPVQIPSTEISHSKQTPAAMPVPSVASVKTHASISANYPVLDEATSFMPDESDETVVMGLESGMRSIMPHLIRKKNNERIPIDKEVFRLGRNIDFNDYAIVDNRFVGHGHCHILSRNGEYYIVDDNSKNHTKVNGTQITSGTEVKLAHEYVISVADEEFEFRLF